MLAYSIIEQAQTERAAPVVLVSKKDKNFWFCVDYHILKAVTKRFSYLIPRIDESTDLLWKQPFSSHYLQTADTNISKSRVPT